MTPVLLLGLLCTPARTVILEAPADPEVLRRVLGQLGDLPQQIEVEARTSTLADPRAHARQLAGRRAVEAVAWIDEDAKGGFLVTVVHLDSGRLLSRPVRPVRDRPPRRRSATKEAVALIVRSTLQAMESWRRRDDAPAPSKRAPPPEPELEVEVEPPPVASSAPLGLEAAIGWSAMIDRGTLGPHGPEARVMLRAGIWAIGVEASTDVPQHLRDTLATIEVVRYRAALGAGIEAARLGPLALTPALSVGASIHHRTTVETGEGVRATPPSTAVALVVRGEARFAYDAEALGGRVGVELGLGADGFVGVPRIAYQRGGETVGRARSWAVQPELRLGLVFRTGP